MSQPSYYARHRDRDGVPHGATQTLEIDGLKLRRLTRVSASGYCKALCPFHDDSNPSLSINARTGYGKCFACNAQVRVLNLPKVNALAKPKDALNSSFMPCDRNLLVHAMLSRRNISLETAKALGWHAERIGTTDYIAFPYFDSTFAPVYRKLRRADGDKRSMIRIPAGACSLLYNLPGLDELNCDEPPIIVEGELDVGALYELGVTGIVSVPDGAGSRLTPSLLAPLARFSAVIIAVDDDDNGNVLAAQLAASLGAYRCSLAHWGDFNV